MMTFAEKLSHVAKDDPKFARSVKRIRIASWVFGLGVLAAAGLAIWSLAIGFSNKTQITKIESPCQKYGSDSKECEEAFSLAVSTITHPQACAVERKAGTLRAIRELADEIGADFAEPCAGARIAQERERSSDRAETRRRSAMTDEPSRADGRSVRDQSAGGDALQPGSTGHQQPGPHDGSPTGNPASPVKPPPSEAAESPAGGKQSAPEPDPAPLPSPVTPQEDRPVQAAAEAITEEAGAAVGGVLEDTSDAVCQLTSRC